jgi:hypothetical protein
MEMRIVMEEARLGLLPESERNDQNVSGRSVISEMRAGKPDFLDMQRTCETLVETDCFGVYTNIKTPIRTWHDIAHELAFDFQVAMKPNNSTPMGLSNAGPMQRFIAAVVPHITGERPNTEQVGKYLKDNPPRLLHREDRGKPSE